MKKFRFLWKYLILLFIIKVSAYPFIDSNYKFLHNNNNHNQKLKNKNGRNLVLNGIDFQTLEELKFPSNILEYLDLSENNQNSNFKQQQIQQHKQQQEQQQVHIQNEQQQEKQFQNEQINQRRHRILTEYWPIISIIHDLKSFKSQKHLFSNKHNEDDDDDDDDDMTTKILSELLIFGKELYKQKTKRNEKLNYDQDKMETHQNIKMDSIKDYNLNENYKNNDENINNENSDINNEDNKDQMSDTDNHRMKYEMNMKKLKCSNRLQRNNSIEMCENIEERKRNAFKIMKREKIKSSRQTQFIPSISIGAMNNLGDFFNDLKHNVDILEKGKLTEHQEKLLEGDHIISTLRKQLLPDKDEDDSNIKPASTAAFLHAIRTYRPSSRIRALVSMQPDGYHGSNFLDPNYMWLGLGK